MCVRCLWVVEQRAHSRGVMAEEKRAWLCERWVGPPMTQRGERRQHGRPGPQGLTCAPLTPRRVNHCHFGFMRRGANALSITVEELRHKPPVRLTLQLLCGQIYFISLFPLSTIECFEPRFTCLEKVGVPGSAQTVALCILLFGYCYFFSYRFVQGTYQVTWDVVTGRICS